MKQWKWMSMILMVVAVSAMVAGSALAAPAAQDGMPVNSLTVTGSGEAYGSPDVAYLEVGVTIGDADVTVAFESVNDTMDAVIQALVDLGLDRKDLRTTGITMWTEERYNPDMGPTGEFIYRVGNTVQITIHDVDIVDQVVSAAIAAGANNIYNFSFGIADSTDLEQEARVAAVADARVRASRLAEAMGVTLGDPIIINETTNQGVPLAAMAAYGGGGGGVPVEEGQLSVSVQLQVTFSINP
jgi:uncharacterized protein YggE